MPKPKISMRAALADDRLLRTLLPGPTFAPHRVMLLAARGEKLTDEELEIFFDFTKRETSPTEPVDVLLINAGRRSAKTILGSTLAAYTAACIDFSDVIAPGETCSQIVLAQSSISAQNVFGHLRAVFQNADLLRPMVESMALDEIRLKDRKSLSIRSNSFRKIRGVSAGMICADELAYWHDSEASANSADEVLNSCIPALATTRGQLCLTSSPFGEFGEFHRIFVENFGNMDDPKILCAHGPSMKWNPLLDQAIVDRAMKKNPAKARAEWLAEFRSDVSNYLSMADIEPLIAKKVRVRPPEPGRVYKIFGDFSSGKSDATTAACGYVAEDGKAVIAHSVTVKAPHSTDVAVERIVNELCHPYRCNTVVADDFSNGFVQSALARHGVQLQSSKLSKSQIYESFIPIAMGQRCVLLDDPENRVVDQILGLRTKLQSGGRVSIDHGDRRGHDDDCNAHLGVIVLLLSRPPFRDSYGRHGGRIIGPMGPLTDSYLDRSTGAAPVGDGIIGIRRSVGKSEHFRPKKIL